MMLFQVHFLVLSLCRIRILSVFRWDVIVSLDQLSAFVILSLQHTDLLQATKIDVILHQIVSRVIPSHFLFIANIPLH